MAFHTDDVGARFKSCAKNALDRALTYLPMAAAELIAAVAIADIDKAIIQRGAVTDEAWKMLRPFVADGSLTCLMDLDEDETADITEDVCASDMQGVIRDAGVATAPTQILADKLAAFHPHIEVLPILIIKHGSRGNLSRHDFDDLVVKYLSRGELSGLH